MALINEQRLLALALKNPGVFRQLPFQPYDRYGNVAAVKEVTIDTVRAALKNVRDAVTKGEYMNKGYRPWDIDTNLFDDMNRAEPWWGWEFEMGYKSKAARAEAVGYAFDNFDGAMFDSEGEGPAPVEITFCPEEQSKYANGTAAGVQFMKWTSANPQLIYNGNGQEVGTHLNMSDPRASTEKEQYNLANFLNNTLRFTRKVNGQREKMFGRETLYAGFIPNGAGKKYPWIELKGFRTVYDYARFEDFLQTAEGLQKSVDAFFAERKNLNAKSGVGNLYDVAMHGAAPQIEQYKKSIAADGAAQLCSRRYGHEWALTEDSVGGNEPDRWVA